MSLGTATATDNSGTATVSNNASANIRSARPLLSWTATDGAGNKATATQIVTVIDSAPPITTASFSPEPNAKGWNNTDVTVSLTSADNLGGSGVKNIHYTINSGSEVIVANTSANFTLTGEGTFNITYYATDNAGNQEASHSLIIKIDRTAPVVTITYPVIGTFYQSSVMQSSGSYTVDDSSATVVESGIFHR